MAITCVGTVTTTGTSIDVSSIGLDPNDLLIVFAAAGSSSPSVPSGWGRMPIPVSRAASNHNGAWILADGSETTISGFTSANVLAAVAYRSSDTAKIVLPVFFRADSWNSSSTWSSFAFTNNQSGLDYWRVCGLTWATDTSDIESSTNSPLVQRDYIESTNYLGIWDTNGVTTNTATLASSTVTGSTQGGTTTIVISEFGFTGGGGGGGGYYNPFRNPVFGG